ncbi:MAG: AI-2E family transporter [Planctomycetes bacterium]|nr:AI-2E family transporter [Planctomycetota bacterium]
MNDSRNEQNRLVVVSLVLIAIVATGVVLLYARSVLIPFVLALFISLLVSPILDFQVLRLKIPRALAVIITLVLILVILAVLFMFVSSAIQSIVSTAGRYSESFVNLVKIILDKVKTWGVVPDQSEILAMLNERVPGLIKGSFGTALGLISSTFLVSIFVCFMLAGRNSNEIRQGIYSEIDHQVRRYIAIKVVLSSITGILVWATLSLFKLELANVFGILAFLLNFIPSIGSIVATLLPIPIAVAQFQNPWMVALVVGVPGIIQMVIGNGVEPKLLGKGLHLHPVTVLMALAFWGLLWGIPGMFLAIPMTAVIRIVLMQFDTLKPIGDILAGRLPQVEKSPD